MIYEALNRFHDPESILQEYQGGFIGKFITDASFFAEIIWKCRLSQPAKAQLGAKRQKKKAAAHLQRAPAATSARPGKRTTKQLARLCLQPSGGVAAQEASALI